MNDDVASGKFFTIQHSVSWVLPLLLSSFGQLASNFSGNLSVRVQARFPPRTLLQYFNQPSALNPQTQVLSSLFIMILWIKSALNDKRACPTTPLSDLTNLSLCSNTRAAGALLLGSSFHRCKEVSGKGIITIIRCREGRSQV